MTVVSLLIIAKEKTLFEIESTDRRWVAGRPYKPIFSVGVFNSYVQ
jgi:hypothetical protein